LSGSKDQPIPSGESIAKRKISYAIIWAAGRQRDDALMSDAQIDTSQNDRPAYFSSDGKRPAITINQGETSFFGRPHRFEPSNVLFLLATNSKVVLLNP